MRAVYFCFVALAMTAPAYTRPNVAVALPSTFGHEVALNGNGQTLIVGHSAESSDADGVGGDWNNYNGNGADSGAVFLY